MEQGFIMIIIRELNMNKYKVEKANYTDLIMDLDLSDHEEDDMTTQERS